MPWTVIFLEDLGLGEKGIAGMLAPVLIRRLTLCFSIVNITRGSSAFMVVTGACMGGPRTHYWVAASGLHSPGTQRQCGYQCFPWQMGHGPEDSFLQGHSVLKWPACSHCKHVLEFGLCPREASLSTAIRVSCHLSFRSLFSFCRSLLLYMDMATLTNWPRSLLPSATSFWSILQISGADCVRNLSFRTTSSCNYGIMLVCFCKESLSLCRKATGVLKGPCYKVMTWE
jgi:hypothetical protein